MLKKTPYLHNFRYSPIIYIILRQYLYSQVGARKRADSTALVASFLKESSAVLLLQGLGSGSAIVGLIHPFSLLQEMAEFLLSVLVSAFVPLHDV